MRGYIAPLTLSLVLASAAGTLAQEGQKLERRMIGLDVESLVITSQVQNRMPVDTLDQVSATQDAVFCWTLITGAEDETTIEHVWY